MGEVRSVSLSLWSSLSPAFLPPPFRPHSQAEGSIRFTASYAPTSCPGVCPPPGDRAGPAASAAGDALARLLDRAFIRSRAVDLESLCVAPGVAAWAVRCDVVVLAACGSAAAAGVLAAAAALRAFRRPDAAVDHATGGRVIVHPVSAVEPVPLTLHVTPLATGFAWIGAPRGGAADGDGDAAAAPGLVLDPTTTEEAVACGAGIALASAGGHVVHLSAGGGAAPPAAEVVLAARLATEAARAAGSALDAALTAHTAAVAAARVRRGVVGVEEESGSDRAVAAAGPQDATALPARARPVSVAAPVAAQPTAVAAVDTATPTSMEEEETAAAPQPDAPSPAPAKPDGWRTAALRAKLARAGGGDAGAGGVIDSVTALIAGAAARAGGGGGANVGGRGEEEDAHQVNHV